MHVHRGGRWAVRGGVGVEGGGGGAMCCYLSQNERFLG